METKEGKYQTNIHLTVRNVGFYITGGVGKVGNKEGKKKKDIENHRGVLIKKRPKF